MWTGQVNACCHIILGKQQSEMQLRTHNSSTYEVCVLACRLISILVVLQACLLQSLFTLVHQGHKEVSNLPQEFAAAHCAQDLP